MPDDPRVQQLLDELLDSHATPEEVCGSCVELLPVVRDRWRQMCRARAELDAMFPPAGGWGTSLPAGPAADAALPVIPGYEVEAVLGFGGMGVVFRVRHLRLKRVVALKMALAGAYAGSHDRERFQREAEAVAALRHPNVVQVHDVGDADRRPYFTMEFVEGGTLAEKLAGTPLPAREAAALLATLAGAVHAAHQCGIVHRDLKPANVLLAADGTPKISDFGLARRLGDEAGLTRTGTAVGTPSYMAPEQAQGKTDAAGPGADVYALGAILYELLTGRPPFRAETGAETVNQLLTQDPVPPSRLNAKVPRDLETICLKCLHKEPRHRYATAAALGEDLERFLGGEAIAARPEGRLARLFRRARRRPVLSAALLVATLSTLALVGGGVWTVSDRAATERAAAADLTEMEDHLRKSSWPAARAAMERARGRLAGRGGALAVRLERGALDLELAVRLDAIRLDGYSVVEGGLDFRPSDGAYEDAFRRAGLGVPEDGEATALAVRVAASPIREMLVAALDHWASCCLDKPGRKAWLLDAIRLADPDATGWRARAADPATWKDEAALAKLIDAAPTAYPSLQVLLQIEVLMTVAGKNPVPLLRRIQQAHPYDFWANARLARALFRTDPREAVRFYQAALAVRPDAVVIQNELGQALARSGRSDEAVEIFQRAANRNPTFAEAQTNLGVTLSRLARHDEAIKCVRAALDLGVRTPGLYTTLGHSLKAKGRSAEALAAFREAIDLDPKYMSAHSGLQGIHLRQGRFDDAQVAWRAVLESDPPAHDAWYGYAELCLFLGREDEYRRAREALLAKFGTTTDPGTAERTSRACLLLPATADDLHQATTLAGRAVAAGRSTHQWAYSHFVFVQGLADYRRGEFDRAAATMRGDAARALGPAPRLVLAMALHRSGHRAESRKTLAAAILSHDWRANRVTDQDGWIYHVLRREAEQLILPNLPALLEGTYQPRDNDERLALLGVCQFTNRTLTAAGLYADAFATAPRLAEDFRTGHRSNAASYAAQAGCGRGADAAGLGEPERAKWRAQAREWLRADLAVWDKALDGDHAAARDGVRQRLTQWRADPDLAGLRDAAEVEKLPPDERTDCLRLWEGVGVLLGRAEGNR